MTNWRKDRFKYRRWFSYLLMTQPQHEIICGYIQIRLRTTLFNGINRLIYRVAKVKGIEPSLITAWTLCDWILDNEGPK